MAVPNALSSWQQLTVTRHRDDEVSGGHRSLWPLRLRNFWVQAGRSTALFHSHGDLNQLSLLAAIFIIASLVHYIKDKCNFVLFYKASNFFEVLEILHSFSCHRSPNPINPEEKLWHHISILTALIIIFPRCTNSFWASRKKRFENKNNHQEEKRKTTFPLVGIINILHFVLINTVNCSQNLGPHPVSTRWNLYYHFPGYIAFIITVY